VNRYALSALQPLCLNPEYANDIIRLEGVKACVQALTSHASDPQVVYHGIAMLAELAQHDGCRSQLADLGVIPVFLRTMDA
jgi:hypothetical protein